MNLVLWILEINWDLYLSIAFIIVFGGSSLCLLFCKYDNYSYAINPRTGKKERLYSSGIDPGCPLCDKV